MKLLLQAQKTKKVVFLCKGCNIIIQPYDRKIINVSRKFNLASKQLPFFLQVNIFFCGVNENFSKILFMKKKFFLHKSLLELLEVENSRRNKVEKSDIFPSLLIIYIVNFFQWQFLFVLVFKWLAVIKVITIY